MRLLDLELSVRQQLRDLPYPAYLLSMSVIGRRLEEVYAEFFPGEGRLLAAQTVAAVKAAYLSGEDTADDLWQLHQRWDPLFEHPGPDGPLGMYAAMEVLDLLALELAGKVQPRTATDQVTNAAKLPDPMASGPAGPQLVRIDPAQQADESSPAVQFMRKCEEVARLAARQHKTGLTCDPDQIYSLVFG
jgi:hypothetical protein